MWVYEPNLTSDYRDFEVGALQSYSVEPTRNGLSNTKSGNASCVFEFSSPYFFSGAPAKELIGEPRDGSILSADIRLHNRDSRASVLLSVEPDTPWLTVWEASGKGIHSIRLDLTRNCEIVFRIEVSEYGEIRRVYAFGSWRSKAPGDPCKHKVSTSFAPSPDGPCEKLFESPVLEHRHRWHFSAQGRASYADPSAPFM